MKKAIIGIICSICLLVGGVFTISTLEFKNVTVECVEVAYASTRYGDLKRYHYMKYPDGTIKSERGRYYEVGKSYVKTIAVNPIKSEIGIVMCVLGVVGIILSTIYYRNTDNLT